MVAPKQNINVLIDIKENEEKLHDMFGDYRYDYKNHGITINYYEEIPEKLLNELKLEKGISPYRNVYSSVNWNEAMTISNLTINGKKWRIPTVHEMFHIKDSFYNYTEIYWAIDEYNPDIPTIVYRDTQANGLRPAYIKDKEHTKAYMLLVRD